MGSCAVLNVGTSRLAELKSDVPAEIMSIFQDSDLVVRPSGEMYWDLIREASVPAEMHIFKLPASDAISRVQSW